MLLSQVVDEGVAFFADGVAGISHASALNHAAPLDAAGSARRRMLVLAYSPIGRDRAIRPCCASRTHLDGLMHHWRATKQWLHQCARMHNDAARARQFVCTQVIALLHS
ncbi:hypothetical protein [Xanthomonas campestris]|uniref:hypothetical protein n=1 Tax=Xanthomonas campestris TaxID=339 RepID=UPI001A11388B|nr:hypothetical protein [Xanthomonas campestris]MBF9174320.1 hypothetical protein [Xanthomonas campestris pv. campestris]MCF8798149.1 hypothetical protein [Xanthomonas campestris pv. campestris]MCF8813519.1 hypothetical protein [Xanthomonas campestris pv. campestris]MDO0845202.1 hypothetical protein [Xanthomonas campestris pv. campestris]MEB1413864.1 hypothetical protein [Xanthomonas campestris pv. campestris]